MLADLKSLGLDAPREMTFDYIALESFFSGDPGRGMPNFETLEKLPELSIMFLVKDEESAKKSGVAISHMGLIISPRLPSDVRSEPTLRHCTTPQGCVNRPLLDYLSSKAGKIAGIKLIEIVDR